MPPQRKGRPPEKWLAGTRIFVLPTGFQSREIRHLLFRIRDHGGTTVGSPTLPGVTHILVRRRAVEREASPVPRPGYPESEWDYERILETFSRDPRTAIPIVEEYWLYDSLDVGKPLDPREGDWLLQPWPPRPTDERGRPANSSERQGAQPRGRDWWKSDRWNGDIRRSASPPRQRPEPSIQQAPPIQEAAPAQPPAGPKSLRQKLTAMWFPQISVVPDVQSEHHKGSASAPSQNASLEQRLSGISADVMPTPIEAALESRLGPKASPTPHDVAKLESRLARSATPSTAPLSPANGTSKTPLHARITAPSDTGAPDAFSVKTEPVEEPTILRPQVSLIPLATAAPSVPTPTNGEVASILPVGPPLQTGPPPNPRDPRLNRLIKPSAYPSTTSQIVSREQPTSAKQPQQLSAVPASTAQSRPTSQPIAQPPSSQLAQRHQSWGSRPSSPERRSVDVGQIKEQPSATSASASKIVPAKATSAPTGDPTSAPPPPPAPATSADSSPLTSPSLSPSPKLPTPPLTVARSSAEQVSPVLHSNAVPTEKTKKASNKAAKPIAAAASLPSPTANSTSALEGAENVATPPVKRKAQALPLTSTQNSLARPAKKAAIKATDPPVASGVAKRPAPRSPPGITVDKPISPKSSVTALPTPISVTSTTQPMLPLQSATQTQQPSRAVGKLQQRSSPPTQYRSVITTPQQPTSVWMPNGTSAHMQQQQLPQTEHQLVQATGRTAFSPPSVLWTDGGPHGIGLHSQTQTLTHQSLSQPQTQSHSATHHLSHPRVHSQQPIRPNVMTSGRSFESQRADLTPPSSARSQIVDRTALDVHASKAQGTPAVPINAARVEGIFSQNLRHPLTFYLEGAPAKLERIVLDSGGELASLAEAQFVVLPLDKGEKAKEPRHRQLVSRIGIHPCARVVSREWIGRSAVYGDELLNPEPFVVQLDDSKDYTAEDRQRQVSELSDLASSSDAEAVPLASLARKRSLVKATAPVRGTSPAQSQSPYEVTPTIPSESAFPTADSDSASDWEDDGVDELEMDDLERPNFVAEPDWPRVKLLITAFKGWDQKGSRAKFINRLRYEDGIINADGVYKKYQLYIDSKVTGLSRFRRGGGGKRVKREEMP